MRYQHSTVTMPPRGTSNSRGTSETASFVERQIGLGKQRLAESFSMGLRGHGVYDALVSVFDECQKPNWDGYQAAPVTRETYREAYQFLEQLPHGVRPPSVGVEPDGHITFEWYKNPSQLLSVSVGPDGMIYFAALIGKQRRSGAGPVSADLVENLVWLISSVHAA